MPVYGTDYCMFKRNKERNIDVEKRFQIGNFCFSIWCSDEIVIPDNLMKFQTESGKIMYTYHMRLAEVLPHLSGTMLVNRKDLQVCQIEHGEERLLWVPGIPEPYAFYQETGENCAEITIQKDWNDKLAVDTIFNSMLALERRMNEREGLILHCAFLKHRKGAILFSAPSETGKSTQAYLWEQYQEHCRTVNGDRALLQKTDGLWSAGGWPVCGDSGICNNLSVPIRAVVMLSQGEKNQVKRLDAAHAFRLMYGQITVNRWNQQANDRAMELLEELVIQVPVYHLSCTISEEAVTCLEEAVYGKGEI